MPQARIASVVELADRIVRRAGIGESGNYDTEVSTEDLAGALGLQQEQIEQVERELPDLVRQKSEVVGLALLRPFWAYCESLREITSQLAVESTKLFEESGRLQGDAGHYDFIRELLSRLNPTMSAVELAKEFAVTWQKFYQTGPVCVYLAGEKGTKAIDAVIVENQTQSRTVILDLLDGEELIPQPISKKFAIIDAGDYVDWLLEQTEVRFDASRTKLAPMQSDRKTVGVIAFEFQHPVSGDIEKRFAPAAGFGAVLLDMLETIGTQQRYAENFAQILSTQKENQRQPAQKTHEMPEALAEMAAGAAHELNNPLSVISGRAQLLANSENDPDRKRILEQIQQNAGELSAIIDDLMSYANPEQPRATETAVRQIVNDAVDLTAQKKKASQLDIKINIGPDTPAVFVDSAQISSAISNIICNGLESYEGGNGSIEIKAGAAKASRAVSIEVIDSGMGMNEQTLAKATQPFFSARSAGRKRGMGLAHAKRLIEINHGTVELASQKGKGTSVTVVLPSNP
jgi:signal transduction histidine kinase